MATLIPGPRTMSLTRDENGYREYKLTQRVEVTPGIEGPFTALRCPGLPVPGSAWAQLSEIDPWVWCRPNASVTAVDQVEGEPVKFYDVELTFSNKPPSKDKGDNNGGQGCDEREVEDPLLEPQRVSGSYASFTEEATHDRFGRAVLTSSHEMIRGPQNEWDKGRDQIVIEQNVPVLELDVVSSMKDTLNDATLWGLPKRSVKLSNYSWERKFHGQCHVYYTRKFTFDINVRTSPSTGDLEGNWDRDILDEGTKVLHGHWHETTGDWTLDPINGADPDKNNPLHFDRFKDKNGENCRVVLDGNGKPASAIAGLSGLFINIVGATGKGLGESTYWIPLQTPVDLIPEWAQDTYYIRGALTTFNGVVYVAKVNDPDLTLDPNADLVFTVANWQAVVLTDRGDFSTTTAYSPGDYVRGTADVAGKIHVEKYDESDFFRLGIPAQF